MADTAQGGDRLLSVRKRCFFHANHVHRSTFFKKKKKDVSIDPSQGSLNGKGESSGHGSGIMDLPNRESGSRTCII